MELPEKFCEEMKRILGDGYTDYLASLKEERKYGLRVNTAKISVEEFLRIAPFPLKKIPYVDNGFYYDSGVQPAKHPYYFAGLYYLQDPSAMTPASRLPVEPGDRVLDLCAAPGGKATELAAKLRGTGLLVANDVSGKRARALLKNIELFGVANSLVSTEYPKKLREVFPGFFDKILIDAPCSGEGMFRKDAAMVRAWEEHGPEYFAPLQEDIVTQAVSMLRPGGYLLYSTCTFSPLEDEGTVEKILNQYPELELVEMQGYEGFEEGNPDLIGSNRESIRRCIRIFPHKMEGEGHFLALFHHTGNFSMRGARTTSKSFLERCGSQSTLCCGSQPTLLEEFLENFNRKWELSRMETRNQMVYYMPEAMPQIRGLRFLRSGLFFGELKKNRFEPSQSLAMALSAEDYKNCLMLSLGDERVLRYLKGETIVLAGEESAGPDGWMLVCVDGYPLGWGKKNRSSMKNKYHSGWRLM